jgi:hypothetical protein
MQEGTDDEPNITFEIEFDDGAAGGGELPVFGFHVRFYYRHETEAFAKSYQPFFENDPDFEKLARLGRAAAVNYVAELCWKLECEVLRRMRDVPGQ